MSSNFFETMRRANRELNSVSTPQTPQAPATPGIGELSFGTMLQENQFLLPDEFTLAGTRRSRDEYEGEENNQEGLLSMTVPKPGKFTAEEAQRLKKTKQLSSTSERDYDAFASVSL